MPAGRMGEAATKNSRGVYPSPRRSQRLKAALDYAARGWPVFPCRGKVPLTRRGHLDATTDPSRITAMFNAHPGANIGIPTGERSGILALDVDHPVSLDELEAEHGELPTTRTHATGSGGLHYLFTYPAGDAGETVRSSAGKLGRGLDVRGEGGYIVAPPSRTTRPYEVLDELPLAEPPAWLLEALRKRPAPVSSSNSYVSAVGAAVEGPLIPEGERNWTLYRTACSLRAGGHSEAEILGRLRAVNRERCAPPLEARELEGIAASAARHAPGRAASAPDAETLAAVESIEVLLWKHDWRGMGGKSARDLFVILTRLARLHGKTIPAGVRVSVDFRTVAVLAAMGLATAHRAAKRLRRHGLIRQDNGTRKAGKAGAFVLVTNPSEAVATPPREVEHSTSGGAIEPRDAYVPPLAPPSSPRLRWSAPEIRRLGKSCGAVIDALEAAGGSATVPELAGALGVKRPRDLRRDSEGYKGPVTRLMSAGVVECFGDDVSLTPDWRRALELERARAGEIEAERRDRAAYDRQREAYSSYHERPADAVPEKPPAGEIRELEVVPDLTGMIGRRCITPRGPGELWDHKGDEARVVLDSEQSAWIPFDVALIKLEPEVAA